MQLTTIEYKGIQYPARETKEGLVSTIELHKKIWIDGKGYPDKEAQLIDEQIPFFASPDELYLPELELLNLFK